MRIEEHFRKEIEDAQKKPSKKSSNQAIKQESTVTKLNAAQVWVNENGGLSYYGTGGQKGSDGQSQDAGRTIKDVHSRLKRLRLTISRTRPASMVIVTESVKLLEALAIRFGDMPISEVIDILLDDAYDDWREQEKSQ